MIMDRIPHVTGLHLDEALELMKHPFAAGINYPLKAKAGRRKRKAQSPVPSSSKEKPAAKKKQKTTGDNKPRDDVNYRKFSSKNMPANVKNLFRKHLEKQPTFSENPDLCTECLKLVSNSLAKRTWNKYSSALALWNQYAHGKTISSFSALDFTCWCSKYTTLKAATVKVYVAAIKKMEFLLGFEGGSAEKELEKILLRGMENVESKSKTQRKKVTPVTLPILKRIKQGLDSEICSSCSKQSIWTLSLAAFWGLIRLGEILPEHSMSFDKTSTLLWKDVVIKKDKVVFQI